MPKLAVDRFPTYRLHKQSGQAIVTLNGRDFLLGKHGSTESQAVYRRRIAEWLANGRQILHPAVVAPMTSALGADTFAAATPTSTNAFPSAALTASPVSTAMATTLNVLYVAFQRHADAYYRRADGTNTSEADNFRDAMRPVLLLYGTSPIRDFGPLALKAVQQEMTRLAWARTNINRQINRVRHVLKWGVAQELVPPSVYQALQAVPGLKRGRCSARESNPVKPVDDTVVDHTLERAPRILRAMIELQRLTGMRPGEVCDMRPCDIDRSTVDTWTYRPPQHKTTHLEHDRVVMIGPRAQIVLLPFLDRAREAYVFSPAESERERREATSANRKTPPSCGNRPGTNRRINPRRKPLNRYTTQSYGQAIARACEKAWPAPAGLDAIQSAAWRDAHRWTPNQLRHSAATKIRQEFGLEAAQVVLGHRSLTVTQVYAEKNVQAARTVVARVG